MNVAVLLFDGVEELDFCGPYEVFGIGAQAYTVSDRPLVRGNHGLKIVPDHLLGDAPQPDILVVPGGLVLRQHPEGQAAIVAYIRRVAPHCKMILSVCTGAFLLARAGLLDGRACTTHVAARHRLQAVYPAINLRFARVVADGRVVTTAGVSAGIDGALYVISRLKSQAEASQIAAAIEYAWHPELVERAAPTTEAYAI